MGVFGCWGWTGPSELPEEAAGQRVSGWGPPQPEQRWTLWHPRPNLQPFGLLKFQQVSLLLGARAGGAAGSRVRCLGCFAGGGFRGQASDGWSREWQ